jgi:hypothetical protein
MYGYKRKEAAALKQDNLTDIITDQTERALWEVKNVIDCVPDEYWDK